MTKRRLDVTVLRDRVLCAVLGHREPPQLLLTVDMALNGYAIRCERCNTRLRWMPRITNPVTVKDLAIDRYFVQRLDELIPLAPDIREGTIRYDDPTGREEWSK